MLTGNSIAYQLGPSQHQLEPARPKLASFPGLLRLQFLIASSMHTGSILEAIKNWRRRSELIKNWKRRKPGNEARPKLGVAELYLGSCLNAILNLLLNQKLMACGTSNTLDLMVHSVWSCGVGGQQVNSYYLLQYQSQCCTAVTLKLEANDLDYSTVYSPHGSFCVVLWCRWSAGQAISRAAPERVRQTRASGQR